MAKANEIKYLTAIKQDKRPKKFCRFKKYGIKYIDYKGAQKKFTSLIFESGGEVLNEKPWGLKSLAYPINKKTTGLYWVVEYKAPSDFNEKLKIQLLRDDNVMRHMFTALDKYAVEYNDRKRSGVPSGTEKAEA